MRCGAVWCDMLGSVLVAAYLSHAHCCCCCCCSSCCWDCVCVFACLSPLSNCHLLRAPSRGWSVCSVKTGRAPFACSVRPCVAARCNRRSLFTVSQPAALPLAQRLPLHKSHLRCCCCTHSLSQSCCTFHSLLCYARSFVTAKAAALAFCCHAAAVGCSVAARPREGAISSTSCSSILISHPAAAVISNPTLPYSTLDTHTH